MVNNDFRILLVYNNMRRNRLYYLLLTAPLILLMGCKKTKLPNFHREYFGLMEGRYVIYDAIEITHDDAIDVHDTVVFQLKTVWGDTVTDNQGRIAREFFRYKRNTSSDPWVLTDVWTGIIDGIRAELIEENQRVVKLVFAPTLDKSWDANAYNMYNELDCYYRDIHQDTTLNGVLVDSTLVVEQDNFISLIDTVRKYEMYAKNIGLVYKHWTDNHYQFTSDSVIEGTEIYYTYVETGFE